MIINSSKLIKYVLLILLLFFVTAIIIICVSSSDNKKNVMSFNEDFNLLQPLVLPQETSVPEDYYLVRPRNYQWTSEDIKRWFNSPDGNILDELHKSNNQMVNDILEVAP